MQTDYERPSLFRRQIDPDSAPNDGSQSGRTGRCFNKGGTIQQDACAIAKKTIRPGNPPCVRVLLDPDFLPIQRRLEYLRERFLANLDTGAPVIRNGIEYSKRCVVEQGGGVRREHRRGIGKGAEVPHVKGHAERSGAVDSRI